MSGVQMSTADVRNLDPVIAELRLIQQEEVDKLRSVLETDLDASELKRTFCSDSMLRRYLLACSQFPPFDKRIQEAKHAIKATLDWRARNVDNCEKTSSFCKSGEAGYCFLPIGSDVLGRPLLYGSPARCRDQDPAGIVSHVLTTLESVLDENVGGGRWVFLLDLNGFKDVHVNLNVLAELKYLIQNIYREQLAQVFVLGSQQVFDSLYEHLQQINSARTTIKSQAISSAEKLDKLKEELGFSAEVLTWLQVVTRPSSILPHFQISVSSPGAQLDEKNPLHPATRGHIAGRHLCYLSSTLHRNLDRL
ncbi:hypothetical protein CYMTET_55904 [Cymbomonas tetramitiformis]|uniref:CRAL-TRIO domain-containing protein n=1 Tax=Cymbomonas tetramitiformis TaxID=36881 RepID=A0AAE0BDC6_9CHLO|nr:hypothetical protein CYMTET_55904 [Cymbomonas tetramitiformis]